MRNKLIMTVMALLMTGMAISAQSSYREKYAKVIAYYSRSAADSLKYKAALYLIDNMAGHQSPEGKAMEDYEHRVRTMRRTSGIRELQSEWNEALRTGPVSLRADSIVVSDGYLIDNIEEAFVAWQQAAWRDDVTFGQFCRYILPYRVHDEHIGESWRKVLRHRYGPLVEGIADMRRAFALVKDSVFKVVALSNSYCPYHLDPMTCHAIGRAECNQRCALLVAVLRALGIPASIDGIPMWADYSNKGHAWVSIVYDGNTYTVDERDSVARRFNPIDASEFHPLYQVCPEDRCPYEVKTAKTPVKVYRICYDHCNEADADAPQLLSSPFIMDVSKEYALNTDVSLKVSTTSTVYLCAYLSGANWMPVAMAKPYHGKVVFQGIGKGSVCVPVIIQNHRRHFLTCPFLVGEKGVERYFTPSETSYHSISVNRKYPLCSYITDTWGFMRGGTFEGSMTDDFRNADTLAYVTTMPFGMTTLPVVSSGRYRYLRYHAPAGNRSSLAELQFYAADGALLTGTPFAQGVDTLTLPKAFDGNPATASKGLQPGYTMGLDLGEGKGSAVGKIVFCPSTDLNFVERGHLYELYYFDTEWHLVSRAYSKGESLDFSRVPKGALLLLKDKTKGTEERIFEYVDGKIEWH